MPTKAGGHKGRPYQRKRPTVGVTLASPATANGDGAVVTRSNEADLNIASIPAKPLFNTSKKTDGETMDKRERTAEKPSEKMCPFIRLIACKTVI